MMSEDLLNRGLLPCRYEPLLVTRKYQQTVEIIARKYTNGTSIFWEDAAQTAHEKIWQAIQARKFIKQGVKEFYHWVGKVSKNTIIDLIRREKHHDWQSLEQKVNGTDLRLEDTLADKFNMLDEIELKDLLVRTIEVIKQLDRLYPKREYLKLWQGYLQGKKQSQIATELAITQGAISKRWQELRLRVVQTVCVDMA